MTRVCRQCARVNPADAVFCYWDGALLAGGAGGPINAGSAPFPSQFVFPGGQVCRNFDQLATACLQHWPAAVDLLKQGFFASFFGAMGRPDLAKAAQQAATYPDADRGLDQLLAKLPTNVLDPPRLKVEPTVISLGILPMGADRILDLNLRNQGMRLVSGSIISDCKWLSFGDGQGATQKLFQLRDEATIRVHVKGQFLRAGNQPLEGRLLVDSNGGSSMVAVRADVPITPFTEGALAGSLTPRQIAEKARAHPKETVGFFEKGLVAQWFTKNGWIYPVKGPSVGGLGGVQQFFEALGLAKPPKVELRTHSIKITGNPGQTRTAVLEVGTLEKKHVFAYAVSDKHWVVPGVQPKDSKTPTSVVLPLTIFVPPTPGETQQANIVVTANGNQKFSVPLTLTVNGTPGDYLPAGPVPLAPGATPIMATPVMVAPIAVPKVEAGRASVNPTPKTTTDALSATPATVVRLDVTRFGGTTRPGWRRWLPIVVLIVTLLALILRDLIARPPAAPPLKNAVRMQSHRAPAPAPAQFSARTMRTSQEDRY
jgi:hypothetical protein